MKDYREVIAKEIKSNREYRGWSQTDLAKACGLSKFIIGQIENNRLPTINEFMALDKVLDGDLYWKLAEL